jgi:hypothetical protein
MKFEIRNIFVEVAPTASIGEMRSEILSSVLSWLHSPEIIEQLNALSDEASKMLQECSDG